MSKCIVTCSFVAEGEGELTVSEGTVVEVVEPDTQGTGWVLVASLVDGRRGFVPADFLGPMPAAAPAPTRAPPAAPPPAFSSATGAPPPPFKQQASQRMSVAVPPAMRADFTGFGGGPGPSADAAATAAAAGGWSRRDAALGASSFARTPIPATRRWFYRDVFGDMQGPFNADEMRQRVDSRHITADTVVVLDVGGGGFTPTYEERALRDLFPNTSTAFATTPVLVGTPTSTSRAWFYVDDAGVEQGPFSDTQMRAWLDDGYFAASTLVRDASTAPGSNASSLGVVFPDPTLAFVGGKPAVIGAASASSTAAFSVAALQFPQPQQQQQQQQQWPGWSASTMATTTGAPPSPFGMGSGRELLRAAMEGGGSIPPPPGVAASAGGGRSERSATMEDTLDLFDKVELADDSSTLAAAATAAGGGNGNGKGGKDAKRPPPPPIRIYGRPDQWPDWKGVPRYSENPQQYPTLLYAFFTRPLNPKAGKILCYVVREMDGVATMTHNKYTLYLEDGDVPLAVAYRHSGPVSTTFEIKILTSAREDNSRAALTVAKLEVNFLGTQSVLHNAVAGHQGKARDLAVIVYESNRSSSVKGPRKMRVGIPDIEPDKAEFKTFAHGAGGSSSLMTSLQSINVKDMIPLINKPPKFNPAKNSFSLDFGGRVTKASVKNFLLVDPLKDPEHGNVIMLAGRVAQDRFNMDVQHPMSLLQAFGIILTSLHTKLGVD